MVALLQRLVLGAWKEWRHDPMPADNSDQPMVGKFKADYSRLTPEEIAQEDEELAEIYANSRPVSR